MAETVMKFGPEWLRALSDGGPNLHNCPTLSAPQKYKLAEYRYGREEMLALFSEKTTLPEELKDSKDILSEKCQIPLALIPMSEEEHRLWSRCVNSDAVLRLAGKTANNVPSERTSDRGVLRGKGLAAERGRGRGRNYYQRGSSYEEEAENGSERRDFRGKAFERNATDETHREKGFDRGLTRNDSIEDGSRRNKDLRSSDNWRSSTRNDDRSWRSRGRNEDGRVRGNSWRSDEHEEGDFRNGFNKKGYNNQHRDRGLSEQWDDCDDDDHRSSLPEWSLDDGLVSEAKVGTFDSSGAFREESIDGDSKDCEEKRWTDKLENKKHCLTQDEKKVENDKIVLKDEKVIENLPSHTGKPLGIDQNCEVTTTAKPTVLSSNEPSMNSESLLVSANIDHNETTIKSSSDDDGFAHLEKAAESMVAQWTAEEDQKERQCKDSGSKLMVVPSHHEDAYKWYYRDPQGELQGPFIPQEMLEWFTAGYFTMDLLVRRGCDEVFSQLGELINTWNRVPFVPGQNPPPIRNVSSPSLLSGLQSSPQSNNIQLRQQQIMQQQQMRQMYLNQQLQMQTQLRQLLAQLKQREGFSDLTPQEQQEVLVQHYISSQQMQRQLHPNIPQEQPAAANHMVQFVPLVAANSNPLIAQTVSSIWDLNGGVITASTLEEIQRQEQERREADEKQRKLIDEQRRRNEEEEHRRRLEELQRKLEEERKRKEEILRKQDEERRMKEEEERVRIEEERRKRDDEKRRLEEQQRRQEEIKRLEELSRKQREEEIEKRRREAEEAERVKQLQEIERQRKLEAEAIRQEQEEVYKRLQEQKKAWGTQSHSQMSAVQSTVSLVEIQRLQEQKEREERLKQAQLQQNMQALFQVQQAQQKQSVTKQQLTWANTNCQNVPVKTLAEIQKEEAERAAKQKQLDDQKNLQQGTVTNAGIWSNAASQLSWKNSAAWDNVSSTSKSAGFWDSETPFVAMRKSTNKSNESAFQPSNKGSCNHSNTKSNSSSRSRKDEEVVMKLFENQRRQQNDEFTQWCIDSLEKFQSFIDIPTFVAFLKDVEPAYEVTDYIKSYLGESKETREFAKNFVEKRSFYRNQAKKEASEELMWGPAPAITPSVNKSASVSSGANVATGDTEATIFTKSGKKKKKGKKVDNSILGFTVQADPDRVNVGEIEQIND